MVKCSCLLTTYMINKPKIRLVKISKLMKPYVIVAAIWLFIVIGSFIILPKRGKIEFIEVSKESIDFSRIMEYIFNKDSDNTCNLKEINLSAISKLGEYNYENSITKPYYVFKNKKTVLASIQIYSGESYRIIDLSTGFIKAPSLSVLDTEGKILFDNERNRGQRIFDFYAQTSGDYIIEYKFEKEDYTKPANKCVSFAIGYQ